jgi:DNA primase
MFDPDQVVSYLQSIGATGVRYLPRADQVRSTCPFHGGTNTTALVVDLNTGKMFCFSCGHSSTVGVEPSSPVEKVEKVVTDLSCIAEVVLEEMKLSYTSNRLRSNNQDILRQCGAGIATGGPNSGRIVFTYRDINQVLHGFKSRGRSKPDMLVENYYNIGSVFYLEHIWRNGCPPIIVEGEFDAVRAVELGFANVLALGGSSMTQERIDKLVSKTKKVFIALDNDRPGRDATNKIAEELNGVISVYDIPYNRKDPGMIQNRQEFYKALMNAQRIV